MNIFTSLFHKNIFSGKKFLGFSAEDNENPSVSTDTENDGSENKVEKTQKNTRERIEKLLKKAEENQKLIEELIEEERKLDSENQKYETNLSEESSNSDSESDGSVAQKALDDHNQERDHSDLDTSEVGDGGVTDDGRFSAYKAQEKINTDLYKKHSHDLDNYSNRINNLKKQHQLMGAGIKNLRQFKVESGIINEIRFRSVGTFEKAKEKISGFSQKFSSLQESFKDLQNEKNDIAREQKKATLVQDLVNHVSLWRKGSEELTSVHDEILEAKKNIKKMVYDLVPDRRSAENFLGKYFEELDLAEETLSKTLDNFLEILQERNFDISGTEGFWNSLSKAVLKINYYIDMDGGILKDDGGKAEERLSLQKEGLDFLEENDFFEEGEYSFAEKITAMQGDIEKNTNEYSRKFTKIQRKIYRDIEKLSDSDFSEKYSTDKESVIENLEKHSEQIQTFQENLKEMGDGQFVQKWLDKYEDSDESRAEALVEMGEFSRYISGSGELADTNERLEQFLDINSMVRVYRFSLYDMYQMFVRYFEKRERLWKRRSERAVANLGVNVFGADTPIGKEFVKESESEEHARVEEFEQQKSSSYGWDIQKDLYSTNDPDEAKACINLLLEKGFMRWDDPDFWKTLNRLEGISRFSEADMNLSADQILSRVGDSCANIWSMNDFKEWDNSMKSKAQSAQDNFKTEFDRYETMPGDARTKILADMIQKKYRGEDGADPARFEGFLGVAIEKGKMNGGPLGDQRLWFLVHGVASGLLSRDAFARINDTYLATYPLIDFFADRDSWKKDGRVVPPGTSGARNGGPWLYEDYLSWAQMLGDNNGSFLPGSSDSEAGQNRARFVYDVIMASETALGRVSRMVRGSSSNWDHDDAGMYSGIITVSDIGTMIARESGGPEKLTPDFWRNVLTNYDPYFRAVLRQIEEGDIEYADSPGWKKIREDKLRTAGDKLRSALAITQTLSKNVDLFGSKRNSLFTAERWEKEGPYSLSANESKEKINRMAEIFLKNSSNISDSERKKYRELLHFNALEKNMEYGKQVLSDGTETDSLAKDMLTGKLGDDVFSNDPDQILKNLQEYVYGGV